MISRYKETWVHIPDELFNLPAKITLPIEKLLSKWCLHFACKIQEKENIRNYVKIKIR